MRRYQHTAFIFRRDLRLEDNTGLLWALRASQQVLPCFIFDPRQTQPHPYQSRPGLGYLLHALADLQRQLQQQQAGLVFFHGLPEEAIARLHARTPLQAVVVNRDYTPFSRQRDTQLAAACQRLGIAFHSHADALLTEPEHVLGGGHKPYQVFTAFYNKARQLPVPLPAAVGGGRFFSVPSTAAPADFAHLAASPTAAPAVGGGDAKAALARLGQLGDYQQLRDTPALAATSGLSVHLKFGTCSVRQVYHAIADQLGSGHPLLRQLYWRDFFTHVAYHNPQVFGRAFISKYAGLPWDNNPDHFAAWCSGGTGFPIVDAGMRELNATGLMHNRVRMIVASFLVKDLHIDWRWGERYFARHLLDYDPCVNNGNWQWAASTGCDAQPYFRIFNPWLQQQKFDPDCQYIYRWLPELRALPAKAIHHWHGQHTGLGYPPPRVDHGLQARLIKAKFQAQAG